MSQVAIVAAKRTAVGNFAGTLASVPADELGATVIRQLVADTGLTADQVSEVILGQVLTAGQGQNPARKATINAGLPETCPAMTINKVCGSGLKAVSLGVQAILLGDAEVVIAGGQENMSQSCRARTFVGQHVQRKRRSAPATKAAAYASPSCRKRWHSSHRVPTMAGSDAQIGDAMLPTFPRAILRSRPYACNQDLATYHCHHTPALSQRMHNPHGAASTVWMCTIRRSNLSLP